MVIQILSSRSRAAIMALMSRCSQMWKSTTMPSKFGTPYSNGSQRLNLGEYDKATGYFPNDHREC